MQVTFTQRGYQESLGKLTALSTGLRAEVLRDALWAAAGVYAPKVRSAAPTGETGALQSGIRRARTRAGTAGRRRRRVQVAVLARVVSSAPHTHLVESGHGGPRPAPAHPFIEPALRSVDARAFSAFRDTAARRLAPFARKIARARVAGLGA